MWAHGEGRVFAVSGVDLRVTGGTWPFADRHRSEIEAHWAQRVRETPGFFNGAVFVVTRCSVSAGGRLSAQFVRTDFKSFLYWRETGFRDESVLDGFGSALILSADGEVLLGRQRAGNLNGGLTYPPSGFIDAADVREDGTIDIDASVAREVAEETGLSPPAISRGEGYIVTRAGLVLSISVPFLSPLAGPALLRAARRHIASDGESELADLQLVAPGETPAELPMLDYARVLLTELPRLEIPIPRPPHRLERSGG
jgi:8-oxo-dGTP pyrophosphatase MutT (NUDIX family)